MAQLPIISYKKILPEVFQNIDKNKIIITLSDLKTIPQLSEIISLNQIIKTGETKLVDYDYETQNKIIEIYLKNYGFLEFKNGSYYFNYTKLKKYFPNNIFYNQLFSDIEPDIIISNTLDTKEINFKNIKKDCKDCIMFYKLNKLSKEVLNYIGILFFTAFYKMENFSKYAKIEYDYFTDINFEFNDFSIITDMKEFFLTHLLTFLKMNNSQFFGSYNFGSNVKYYIQTKFLNDIYEKIYADINGFISDLNKLYDNFLTINYVKIDIKTEF
jgi:hypothetical protein